MKDADKQAQAIARAAGKRVGKIISITDDNAEATSTIGKVQTQKPLIMPCWEKLKLLKESPLFTRFGD